jgi:hypothetical protein
MAGVSGSDASGKRLAEMEARALAKDGKLTMQQLQQQQHSVIPSHHLTNPIVALASSSSSSSSDDKENNPSTAKPLPINKTISNQSHQQPAKQSRKSVGFRVDVTDENATPNAKVQDVAGICFIFYSFCYFCFCLFCCCWCSPFSSSFSSSCFMVFFVYFILTQ